MPFLSAGKPKHGKHSYFGRFLAWLAIYNFVDLAAMWFAGKGERHEKKRVVFARLDGVGDYVLWTNVFDAMEQLYPLSTFERILIATPAVAGVVDDKAPFEKKFYIDRKRFAEDPAYRFRALRAVRKLDADIFINPTATRDMLWADSLARVSRARTRIGHTGRANRMIPTAQRICDGWYTQLVETPQTGHALAADREFVNSLGMRSPGGRGSRGSLGSRESRESLGSWGSRGNERENNAVIFLGAGSPEKRWPVERFAEVAKFLRDEYKLDIAISAGPNERELKEEFADHFNGELTDLVGCKFSELEEAMRTSRLCVTNDTSAAHIAAAARCPTVIIVSGAHDDRFFPYPKELDLPQVPVTNPMPCFGCEWNCVYTEIPKNEPKPCISEVGVEDVIAAIRGSI